MKLLPDWITKGYLRLIDPVANWLVKRGVHPNTITVIGTFCTLVGGTIYATGHIRTGGWFLGLTALFDVLDGTVARRSNTSSTFGAFLDSTLDRLADGFVLGGLAVFYATSQLHGSVPLLVVALLGLIGAFLTSYTRARAEALGLDAKVGLLQRPERVVLLSAPQAFFGLVFDGWVLAIIIIILTVTAWITVVQRWCSCIRRPLERKKREARAETEARPRFCGAQPHRAPIAQRRISSCKVPQQTLPPLHVPPPASSASSPLASAPSPRRSWPASRACAAATPSRSARSRRWRRSGSASAPRTARR